MAISELVTFDGGLSTKKSSNLIARNEGIVCQNVDLEIGSLKPISSLKYITTTTGYHLRVFNDILIHNENILDERFYAEFADRLYWTDGSYNGYGLMRYEQHPTPDATETTDTTTADYTAGQYILQSTSDVMYECIMASTTGVLLTNATYFTALPSENAGVPAEAPVKMTDAQLASIVMEVNTVETGRLTYNGEYTYAFTMLDENGVESSPAIKVSGVLLNNKNHLAIHMKMLKTDWSTLFAGSNGINIYRTGGDNPTFNLIAENLSAEHASIIDGDLDPDYTAGYFYFVDTIADIDVSRIELTTFENTPPPENIDMLVEHKGTLFASNGKNVHFSQTGAPEFWGALDYVRLDGVCTGLGIFGNAVIAFTKSSTYMIEGNDRDNISLQKLPFNQGCVNKFSIVNIDNYLVWTSLNGVCLFNGADVQVITKKTIAWDEFKRLGNVTYDDYANSAMKWDGGDGFNIKYATGYRDKYYGVFSNGVMIIDLADGLKVSSIYAENVVAAKINEDDNFLYIVIDNGDSTYDVYGTFQSDSKMTATWKTGRLSDGSVNVKKHYRDVELDGVPINVTVFVDGKEFFNVAGKERFFLPAGAIGHDIQFEINTINEIRGLKYEYTQLKA